MDAMTTAKKTVLKDLIKEMRGRMAACGGEEGDKPEGGIESALKDEAMDGPSIAESQEPEEDEMPQKPLAKPKGVTITLAAIKRGTAAREKSKLPPVLEKALMSKKAKA